MKIFGITIIVLVILYGLCGVLMALYEKIQTDDPFNPVTILTWLPKIFG